jgi:hypothetical protein
MMMKTPGFFYLDNAGNLMRAMPGNKAPVLVDSGYHSCPVIMSAKGKILAVEGNLVWVRPLDRAWWAVQDPEPPVEPLPLCKCCKAPKLPSVSLPSISLPSVSLPSVSMPSIGMPDLTLKFDEESWNAPASDWNAQTACFDGDKYIYVHHRSTDDIYVANVETGFWSKIGEDWRVICMAWDSKTKKLMVVSAANRNLCALCPYRVDSAALSNDDWSDSVAMWCDGKGYAYIACRDDQLWKVDTSTGEEKAVGQGNWSQCTRIWDGPGGKVFALFPSGIFQVDVDSGKTTLYASVMNARSATFLIPKN